MNVSTGSANNSFVLQGSGADYTTITGGAGDDSYSTGTNTIAPSQFKPVAIDGASGSNILFVSDENSTGSHVYNFTNTATAGHGALTRDAEATVFDWANAEMYFTGGMDDDQLTVTNPGANLTFSGGGGNDTMTILGTLAGTSITAADLSGNNTYRIGSATASLDQILGTVRVDGNVSGAYTRNLIIDDTAASGGHTYTLSNASSHDTLSRSGTTAFIRWQNLSNATISAGSGANTISANLYSGTLNTTINGNSSADSISITGSYQPIVVNGGDGDDTFTLGANQTIGGLLGVVSIDGGAGADTILADDTASATYYLVDNVTGSGTGSISKNADGGEGGVESYTLAQYSDVETRTISG